jgi:hypothetical protein
VLVHDRPHGPSYLIANGLILAGAFIVLLWIVWRG